jgi:protein tyrosine phosphatase (PTP) superfamily phosphohydrolase (DUF442 family)
MPVLQMTRRRMNMPIVIAAICGLVALAGFLVWRQWYATYHLATVHAGKVYRDGNRGPREFATMLRCVKPKTIVALIDDNEIADPSKPEFKAELDTLKQQGIAVERIPVTLGGWPSTADVQKFLAVAADPAKQPVLVHCAQGVRRTGMMVAAYQESVLGYNSERAKREILRFGHSDRSIGDVRKFIDVYDPAKREVTQELAMSKE